MMKSFDKPSLMIVCSFMLGYLSLFLPLTRVQYQVSIGSPSNTDQPTVVLAEAFSRISGGGYGRDAFPCRFPHFTTLSSPYIRFYPVWNWLGKSLWIGIALLWAIYATRQKVPPMKVALFTVVASAVALVALILLNPNPSLCIPDARYRLISFASFWLTFVFLLGGLLFAFRALHLIKPLDPAVSGIVGTGNAQP